MAKKKSGGGKETFTVAVKIERSLAGKAKMIATDKNVSLAEYISEIIRPTVERDWGKLIKKTEGET
jgi:predicted HicB family RNase H-like nuclease